MFNFFKKPENIIIDPPKQEQYSEAEIAKRISQEINLDKDFALYLLNSGKTGQSILVNHLEKFQDLNHQEIALKLIETGRESLIGSNLDKFKDLNQEIALKLIESECGHTVAYHLDKFQDLDYQEIILTLIKSGYGHTIDYSLNKFLVLNQASAFALIDGGEAGLVFNNLEKFQDLNHQKIALKLISSGDGNLVLNNLEKFQDLNHQEIALASIGSGYGMLFVSSIAKFQNLNHQEIALKLVESGSVNLIAYNLDKFQGLNYEEIALTSMSFGHGASFISNLEKFPGLNHQRIVLELIAYGGVDLILRDMEKFQLAPEKLYQEVKKKYASFITQVETKIPMLSEQLSKSAELLLNILKIKGDFSKLEKNIIQNPFLLEATKDNSRYGSKLMFQYQKFDKTSQKNIKKLFNNEAEILKKHPGINKDSVEFRVLMQEKLVSHANNKRILKKIENRDVNVKEWSNYDKQTYFTLGESENIKFSDQIRTPITRIKETLNKYQDSIINTLSDYKKELQESFVPNPGKEELKQRIVGQKERIASETDENKVKGMQQGLANLEAKEAALKPASVWSKVQSDIFRLKSMIDNIFKFHDACTEIETKIETTRDRKELIKEKDNLEKSKTQLRDNFQEFELFFESYETKLQELIIPSLGKDRSVALLQEIKETIGEEFSHYDTDKNTLKNIFNENNEHDNKLAGREMKISISSRSTQDLYLGNYCPCCIRIDSKHHGAESPIADYVTDLGMQNIVIYDEKTKQPVVACWAFIGENKNNGEAIMVIDNIEANTAYTNNYPDKLKEIISEYINDYAKAANITNIIQGETNNDLIVFKTGKVKEKLGDKYNRPGGYYLEAKT